MSWTRTADVNVRERPLTFAAASEAAATDKSTVGGAPGVTEAGIFRAFASPSAGVSTGQAVLAGFSEVAADDKQVLRPCGRHVEQPVELGLEILVFLGLIPVPVRWFGDRPLEPLPVLLFDEAEVAERLGAVAHDSNVRRRGVAPVRIGQEHDGRLEPLRLVQVHEPDDVGAPGLERKRIDVRRIVCGILLEAAPAGERPGGCREREPIGRRPS